MKKGYYYIFNFRPYPRAYWLNNMSVVYEYCPFEKDFIKSELDEQHYFPDFLIGLETLNKEEVISVHEKNKFNHDIKELISLPIDMIKAVFYLITFPLRIVVLRIKLSKPVNYLRQLIRSKN